MSPAIPGLRAHLLQLALPLVRTHGFTREALAQSVFSLPKPHPEPLSDRAVSSLFGEGDQARVTLISHWLEDARTRMASTAPPSPTIKEVLSSRLSQNEPILDLLPEAFALLATSSSPLGLDPRPALAHTFGVADEACYIVRDQSVGPSWYARRGVLAAVYGAAELHQIKSPQTTHDFLNDLLEVSSKANKTAAEAGIFADYIRRSLVGLFKSRGIYEANNREWFLPTFAPSISIPDSKPVGGGLIDKLRHSAW